MDDMYEHYCEIAKRYQNEEEDLDRCINVLTKLKEANINPLDTEIADAAITKLRERRSEAHKSLQAAYDNMVDLADYISAAYDPDYRSKQKNVIY